MCRNILQQAVPLGGLRSLWLHRTVRGGGGGPDCIRGAEGEPEVGRGRQEQAEAGQSPGAGRWSPQCVSVLVHVLTNYVPALGIQHFNSERF